MGRRAHNPDPASRRQVEAMAAYGIPEMDIARVLGLDPKTLRKHYRDELDMGETKANAQVAGFLFNAARSGNVTAQIFWLKTRARWKETPQEHVHGGTIEVGDARGKIERMIAALHRGGTQHEPAIVEGFANKEEPPALKLIRGFKEKSFQDGDPETISAHVATPE